MSAAALPDVLGGLRVVHLPMRVRFRGITVREVALFEGPSGWGEFGAFPEYGPEESARWLGCALEAAYAAWPEPVRDAVPINATLPAVGPDDVPGILHRFEGTATVKVKVADPTQTLSDDVDRIAAVRANLGPDVKVRIDANGAWTVAQAMEALGRMAPYGLEYAEQPCATVEELRDLRIALARRGIDVPIAADESIRRADDPLRVRQLDAADLIVVKVAPLGGVERALGIVEACGLPAVVSSALDSSVGISAGIALAAALPSLEHACGLGTVGLFDGDVVSDRLRPVGGVIRPRRVVPDEPLLDRFAAPPDRLDWWRDRVTSCWPFLSR